MSLHFPGVETSEQTFLDMLMAADAAFLWSLNNWKFCSSNAVKGKIILWIDTEIKNMHSQHQGSVLDLLMSMQMESRLQYNSVV